MRIRCISSSARQVSGNEEFCYVDSWPFQESWDGVDYEDGYDDRFPLLPLAVDVTSSDLPIQLFESEWHVIDNVPTMSFSSVSYTVEVRGWRQSKVRAYTPCFSTRNRCVWRADGRSRENSRRWCHSPSNRRRRDITKYDSYVRIVRVVHDGYDLTLFWIVFFSPKTN